MFASSGAIIITAMVSFFELEGTAEAPVRIPDPSSMQHKGIKVVLQADIIPMLLSRSTIPLTCFWRDIRSTP